MDLRKLVPEESDTLKEERRPRLSRRLTLTEAKARRLARLNRRLTGAIRRWNTAMRISQNLREPTWVSGTRETASYSDLSERTEVSVQRQSSRIGFYARSTG